MTVEALFVKKCLRIRYGLAVFVQLGRYGEYQGIDILGVVDAEVTEGFGISRFLAGNPRIGVPNFGYRRTFRKRSSGRERQKQASPEPRR